MERIYGRTIIRRHFETVSGLKMQESMLLSVTSCSLLHVPYTLENESRLSEDYIKHLSFAVENLQNFHS